MSGWDNWGKAAEQADVDFTKPKTFADYDKLVRAGLPTDERERMSDAYDNLRYANGHFDDVEAMRNGKGPLKQTSELWDPIRPSSDDCRYEKSDFTLSQPVMRRIVGKLSENLYKRSPTRELADKGVSAIVNEIYKKQRMAAKWQEADRFTIVGGVAAWQFAGEEDVANPLRIHLWSADQICAFTDPYDHETVRAVVTMEKVDGRTKATLWTEDQICEYTTKRDQTPAGGTRRFIPLAPPRDNPYRMPEDSATNDQGRGILPFEFAHFNQPITDFTYDSPGNNLRELNRYINFGFDDLADGIRYITKPIGLAEGVDPEWEAPAIIRPGMFLNLAPGQVDQGGNGPLPSLRYLEADNSFVGVIWAHLNNYLDLAMELENVPPSTVRMVLDARSGVSILAEQAPLLGWTEHRRRPFADYELKAIIKLLNILSAHLRNHGKQSQRLDASARDPGLSLRWPRLYVDLPGQERDRQDGVRLQWTTASLIDIVQEREDLTREQALEQLKRVKADNDELRALGINPLPASLATPQSSQSQSPWGQQSLPAIGGDNSDLDSVSSGGGNQSGIQGENVDSSARGDSLSQEGG